MTPDREQQMTTVDARWLTDDTGMIDLNFLNIPRVIAAYVLPTSDGIAVIETGPTTVLPTLIEGIRALGLEPADVRHILVTHIHLDHAGAVGTWTRQLPEARFYVHEIGAPHMLDPANLIRSATRIYGDDMQRLWGEFLPVPEERTTVIRDGDPLELGGRILDVVYTPGHASHHVAFHEPATGFAFVGDVGGIRVPPSTFPIPPTPPPDVDIAAWKDSIRKLRELHPTRLLLAHFGPVEDIATHLAGLEASLDTFVALVEDAVIEGVERDAIVERMAKYVGQLVEADGSPEVERQFSVTVPYGMATDGLLRYLRKRDEVRG